MFAKYQRCERALLVACAEMYFQEVSTRNVKRVLESLCDGKISSMTVRCSCVCWWMPVRPDWLANSKAASTSQSERNSTTSRTSCLAVLETDCVKAGDCSAAIAESVNYLSALRADATTLRPRGRGCGNR
ncbi:MAG: hypothetical protein EA377_05295 [Phycisphaerales bacterium]|nr:MAG: hypothetical protein EA377_05295 [Phycisphaerales bacterium]